ncbi:transposase [Streptosporangium album]|uniref:transposase n=1 Tax=Streptosporangium album TaxID=47479 RepID=UPI001609071F|nr:transposase [Streptosporangium album]
MVRQSRRCWRWRARPTATRAGNTLIGHRLFLPGAWAADEERRELSGVPEEVMFATKPQLACEMPTHARERGVLRA